jgi:hypothetical protein
VAITVILNNDSDSVTDIAKNDNESDNGDIMRNNGWCEYLDTEKLHKMQLYCSAKWTTDNKMITDARTALL